MKRIVKERSREFVNTVPCVIYIFKCFINDYFTVNFQNGELKDAEAKKMSCGLFYDKKKKKSCLALSNGQIVYRGYKPDTSQDLMRTMLVLHNRETGRVRLVQVERWQVSPVLDKPAIEDNKTMEDDKIAILNKQFGSKKVRRRTEQREKLRINVDSVKEQLEQTVSSKIIFQIWSKFLNCKSSRS